MTQPANTAARRLVETLVMNGIDRVFCVPGESYLAVLDALADVRAACGPVAPSDGLYLTGVGYD